MCILNTSTHSNTLIDSIDITSMNSSKINSSNEEQQQQQQQEISTDSDDLKVGPRTNSPSSLAGTRSDVDSPVRSYALIETDPTELDRIIDILRQFFPNTRIVECNSNSSNPSRTPSRSSLNAAAPQQTSIESNSSLRVPTSNSNRHRSHSHSVSEKSSFESDFLQSSIPITPDPTVSIFGNVNDSSIPSLTISNSQVMRKKKETKQL